MPIAHAVVARQVAGCFGRSDDIIGRNGQLSVGQGNVYPDRAELFKLDQCGFNGSGHLTVEAGAEILARHADAQALQRPGAAFAVAGAGFVKGLLHTAHHIGRTQQSCRLVESMGSKPLMVSSMVTRSLAWRASGPA